MQITHTRVKFRNFNPTQKNSKSPKVLKLRVLHPRKMTNSKRPEDMLGLGQEESTANWAEFKTNPSQMGRGDLRKMTGKKKVLEKVLRAKKVRLVALSTTQVMKRSDAVDLGTVP